mgnify:CR=1 FL=1
MIKLRDLQYLDAIAEHRHFGRAAEACAVSQPALSMQIKEISCSKNITLPFPVSTELEVPARSHRILVAQQANRHRNLNPSRKAPKIRQVQPNPILLRVSAHL